MKASDTVVTDVRPERSSVGPDSSPTAAAIGFSPHSGWAVAVTIVLEAGRPQVVDRRRIELSAHDVPVQPYHAAAALDREKAAALIARADAVALEGALAGLDAVGGDHRHVQIIAVGVPESAVHAPADLARILSSHPLLHTAEGELFREAIASAAHARGLRVDRLPTRDLLSSAAAALRRSPDDITRTVSELGRALGPPWRKDEKDATVAAWVALATS